MYTHWERQQAISRNMYHSPPTPLKTSPTPGAFVSNTIEIPYYNTPYHQSRRVNHIIQLCTQILSPFYSLSGVPPT